jgi:tRNA threonylcarbamoyladenosine biosynthesis protein TsaE
MTGIELVDEAATMAFGESIARELAQKLPDGGVIFLHGDLGAGKTTLTRGILRGLGYSGTVRSPTYTLVEHYPTEPSPSAHFDLYRLSHPEELEFIGARDELVQRNYCLIEWPERAQGCLGEPDVEIYLRFNHFKNASQVTKNTRQIDIQWHNTSHGQ